MNCFKNASKGFTLVEFLFVAFTMALFMTALFRITQGGLQAYQRGVVQTELKHELRNIMDRVTTDVRQGLPNSFTSPPRINHISSTDPHAQLMFDRYKYTADNTVPQGNVSITYSFGTNTSVTIGSVTYYFRPLIRRVTDGGTSVLTTLSEITIGADNSSGTNVNKSGFMWDVDPYTGGAANLDTIKFRLKLMRTHSGSVEPETVENTVRISLRAGKGLAAGSNYYPPTVVSDPYANLQRFGNPTSLVKP